MTRVGGGPRKNITKCDIEEGSKILGDILAVSDIFLSDILFEWPHTAFFVEMVTC